MYDDIAFRHRTCSGHLIVDLEILRLKKFQNKDEPFNPAVRPGKTSPRVKLQYLFYKAMENRETVLRSWLLYSKTKNHFIVSAVASP